MKEAESISPQLDPLQPRLVAERLLSTFDETLPLLSVAVIHALRQLVEEHKYRDPARALQIGNVAVLAASQLALRTEIDNSDKAEAEAVAAWAKAAALLFGGQPAEALVHYRQAETLYRALVRPLELVSVQAPLVYALNATGEQQAALHLAESVRLACLRLGDAALRPLAQLEMNVGTIYKQQGKFGESLAACDRARAAFTSLQDEEGCARVDLNRANVLQEMDQFDEAAAAYAAARTVLSRSARNQQQVALVDFNLGLLAERTGRYQRALRYLEQAHDGFTPPVYKALVDLNRALIYNRLNLSREAIPLAHSARQVFAEQSMPMEEAHTLYVQAVAQRRLGNLNGCTELLEAARDRFAAQAAHFWVATAEIEMATVALSASEPLRAHQLAEQVRQATTPAQWPTLACQALLVQAQAVLQAAPQTVDSLLPSIETAREIAQTYRIPELLIACDCTLGEAHLRRHDPEAAWRAYEQAIAASEQLRAELLLDELQIGFMDEKSTLYRAALRLLFNQSGQAGAPGPAALLYTLNLACVAPLVQSASLASQADATLLTELHTLSAERRWHQHKQEQLYATESGDRQQEIAARRTALDKIDTQLADHWRRLNIRNRGTQITKINHQDPKAQRILSDSLAPLQLSGYINKAEFFVDNLQAALEATEALLVYARIDDQVCLIVVTAQKSQLLLLGSALPIDQALHAWRYHLNDHDLIVRSPKAAQGMAQRILGQLQQALIALAQSQLASFAHLYLVLPPIWHDLPFAALWDGHHYLVERFQLTFLSAPEALLDRRPLLLPDTATKPSAVVIGYSLQGALLNNLTEARQVATALQGAWSTTLLEEADATATNLYAAATESQLIHLATHAVFEPANPLFSQIHLADRELTVAELYHQAVFRQQPLVVLSACETGRGAPRGGGLLGMARAFMAAGAHSLLVTLWRVEDETTAQIMQGFYTQLQIAPSNPGIALCHIQRQVAQRLHPFFWAGIIFVQA